MPKCQVSFFVGSLVSSSKISAQILGAFFSKLGWFPRCRSAGVNFFSVFLCQSCRDIWRGILVKISVLRFPGFGGVRENFTKISRQKRCEKRKISRKFHSAGGATLSSFLPTLYSRSSLVKFSGPLRVEGLVGILHDVYCASQTAVGGLFLKKDETRSQLLATCHRKHKSQDFEIL